MKLLGDCIDRIMVKSIHMLCGFTFEYLSVKLENEQNGVRTQMAANQSANSVWEATYNLIQKSCQKFQQRCSALMNTVIASTTDIANKSSFCVKRKSMFAGLAAEKVGMFQHLN